MEGKDNMNARERANIFGGALAGFTIPVIVFRHMPGMREINYENNGLVGEIGAWVSAISASLPYTIAGGVGGMIKGMYDACGLYKTRRTREITDVNPELLERAELC